MSKLLDQIKSDVADGQLMVHTAAEDLEASAFELSKMDLNDAGVDDAIKELKRQNREFGRRVAEFEAAIKKSREFF